MNKDDMTRIVNEELEHIPKINGSNAQTELRMLYNMSRRSGLKTGKNKEDILYSSINIIKKTYPSWTPSYDERFFHISI